MGHGENVRLIGHLKNESSARTLSDYLLSVDIRNMVEPDAEGWAIWIYSEDQIETGRQALTSYMANPSDRKFQTVRGTAEAIQEKDRRENADYAQRIRTPDNIWTSSPGRVPVTMTLIGISVGVTLLYMAQQNSPLIDKLFISSSIGGILPEVEQGQIWRLITPIFIHFGVLHILFNMLMLRDFGSLIEMRQGARRLLTLVLVLGVGSNLSQYFYAGPDFGGMSGVLYGLMGYIWLRGHTDPASGLFLPPTSIVVMLVWFFLCLFNVIQHVANGAHVAGLIMGMIIGAFPMARRKA